MAHDGLPEISATAIVADDHKLLRDGIKQILESLDGISIVAEARDGLEAISLVRQHKPGLLTLDMAMPYAQGLEIYEEVRRWSPDTRIIVFTGLTSLGLLSELVTAGVDGLFAKRGDPDKLRESVPVILSGGSVYLLQAATPALSDLFWLKPLIGLFVAYVVLVLLSLRLSLDDDDRLILNAVVSKTRLVTTGKSL